MSHLRIEGLRIKMLKDEMLKIHEMNKGCLRGFDERMMDRWTTLAVAESLCD